ncbi:pentapeptide repeat-containing protein [Streptomyces sp. E11-3]|uniref:pentapeptide repeat-containing protein n=1 Tax=Streptomyces sp. E11-3 TaxID=3110112 RepID=UPI003980938E
MGVAVSNHPTVLDRPSGMAHPNPEPSRTPPAWPYCRRGNSPENPVGCRGIHVGGHTACLAHLDEVDRAAYLAALSPGAEIDHRGTPFTPELLDQLLAALRDPTNGRPHTGVARFDRATFSGDAAFDRTTFSGDAVFEEATFSGSAVFVGARFSGHAVFAGATFSGSAAFVGARFSGSAVFGGATFSGFARFVGARFSGNGRFGVATFSGDAAFDRATFSGEAAFDRTTFSGDAVFEEATFSDFAVFVGARFSGRAVFAGATFSGPAVFVGVRFSGSAVFVGAMFSGDAEFSTARFEMASYLGPLLCGQWVVLNGVVFQQPVTVEIVARHVSCARTRWASTATLHLRYADLDLRDAVLEYPVAVAARPDPFLRRGPDDPLSEVKLSDQEPGVRLTSVSGVDAAHLALQDIDLSTCQFAGAVHLDQLKVDGWCTFAATPIAWGRRFPWRWTRRNTLAEEHHWRVRTARHPTRARGWTAPPEGAHKLRPAALAALYRQLRKSLEDGKNEPDAADFYYGECEMRRHDATRPWAERALLTAYWALSGYGLRAARALAWLGLAMATTIAVMVLWGLPVDDPKQTITGRQTGPDISLTADTPDPVTPTGPWTERVTTERLEKALQVVINSVVFRSSGQNLTTTGTYTEMTSRLAEPVLLALAVLAVRSRVKR